METKQLHSEEVKIDYLASALVTVGEIISIHLNNADFQAIRTLKYYLDQLFIEVDKAVSNSKFKAVSGIN